MSALKSESWDQLPILWASRELGARERYPTAESGKQIALHYAEERSIKSDFQNMEEQSPSPNAQGPWSGEAGTGASV